MDKEAKKIYTLIEDRVITETLHTGGQIDELTVEILQSLKELGYHKQPSSPPPVLSELEAIRACKTGLPSDAPWREIAQVQRDADVEYYKKGYL